MYNEELGTEQLKELTDKMFRFAKSITGDAQAAEDVVQDVFVKILSKGHEPMYRNLEAFAMTSVRNRCFDHLRHIRFQSKEPFDAVIPVEDKTDWDLRRMITDAMRKLPRRQRAIVHLKDIEGYDNHEISRIMSIGENNVRTLLSRARKAMREEITKTMNYGTKR